MSASLLTNCSHFLFLPLPSLAFPSFLWQPMGVPQIPVLMAVHAIHRQLLLTDTAVYAQRYIKEQIV